MHCDSVVWPRVALPYAGRSHSISELRPHKAPARDTSKSVGYCPTMTDKRPSPIRETDDIARKLAHDLIANARHAALAVLDEFGAPSVTRIAFGATKNGQILSLISDLSAHSKRLRSNPRCGLLIGEPPAKGDPLAFARMSIAAEVRFLSRGNSDHTERRAAWLKAHPKSALYVDFGDFNFIEFTPLHTDLNGGFGKAYRLTPEDLSLGI